MKDYEIYIIGHSLSPINAKIPHLHYAFLGLNRGRSNFGVDVKTIYRGSPPYTFFGTWKKHKPKNVLVETVLVIFV